MRARRASIAFVLLLVLGACGDEASRPRQGPSPSPTVGVEAEGSWQLKSGTLRGDPVPIVPDHRIMLTIEGREFGGRAACNLYGGTIRIEGDAVALTEIAQTEMGCPPPIMASEKAYMAALPLVDTVRREGSILTLSGPETILRFVELPDVDDDLFGTLWVLDALIEGDIVTSVGGERATLRLDSGRLEGTTGCRRLTGRYVERGDVIFATALSAHGRCPADLSDQDGYVVGVLGDGFTATVEGDRLTLTSMGGIGLIYRAASAGEE
ncbi:MAG TPA: META domain-containing protein [Actinomycetota bacterium]